MHAACGTERETPVRFPRTPLVMLATPQPMGADSNSCAPLPWPFHDKRYREQPSLLPPVTTTASLDVVPRARGGGVRDPACRAGVRSLW